MNTKREIIDKHQDLSLTKQCGLMALSRSSYYYLPEFPTEEDLRILNAIDEIYTDIPFYGYRKIHQALLKKGFQIGKDRVLKYMRILGLKPFYPEQKTSIPNKEHKVYPYLLKDIEIVRPNQVWATDITYIRMKKGFCYMVAIIDWHSRKILSYRLSNTMDVYFCLDALNEALEKCPKPEIFNTDQGSQFTSKAFTKILHDNNIKISMDGKGRAIDNIIIERFWRSIKYENIYLYEHQNILELQHGISKYIKFYNSDRFHETLGYKTPDDFYKAKRKEIKSKTVKLGQLTLEKVV